MSLVRARVFAEMVQDAFTQALGEGICTVSVTGAGEGDVKEVSFEARFNLPAGIVFGLDGGILDHDDANLREGAAQVSASLSQDISREVLAMATALLQADVQTFRVSPEAAAHQATADMVDEALEQLVAEGLVEVVPSWPGAAGEPFRARKKPVVIEAMIWGGTAQGATPIIDWVLSSGGSARYDDDYEPMGEVIIIDTLEGVIYATPGDVVIRGVQGEFYPCKRDIFDETYEVVEEVSPDDPSGSTAAAGDGVPVPRVDGA